MGGFGWFMIKHLLPRQDRFIDEFVKESRANRKVFVDAVEIMGRRLDKVEENLDDIHKSMSEIKFNKGEMMHKKEELIKLTPKLVKLIVKTIKYSKGGLNKAERRELGEIFWNLLISFLET
jgi:hypothetical protein